MMLSESKLSLSVLFAVGAWLAVGCAASPPPPPQAPGQPPPELQIGNDEEAQGEAPPAPAPSAPEPTQAPAMPGAAPPPPPETGQMAPQSQPPAANPPGPLPGPAPVAQPAAEPPPNGGQWIYTSQYGWLYMPYSRDYTYVSGDGGAAYEYAYYPNSGWRWVYAPWVLGWGPSPYWGRLGPRHYVWYSRPWFRVGVVHRGPVYHRRWHRR
jgi:hypothetical protein